jgi:hypothetical protein
LFAFGQNAKKPEFDVATVKAVPLAQLGDRIDINLGTVRNGRVTLANVTLSARRESRIGRRFRGSTDGL